MFAATLHPTDPDRLVRWALTATTLISAAAFGGLVAIITWLASLTAQAILAWIRLWFGLPLLDPLYLATIDLVEIDLIEPEEDEEIALADAWTAPEPWELLGDAPPVWTPPPPEPSPLDVAMAREAGLLSVLAEASALSSLFGSADAGSSLSSEGGVLGAIASGDSLGLGLGESMTVLGSGGSAEGIGGIGGGRLGSRGSGTAVVGEGGGGTGLGTIGIGGGGTGGGAVAVLGTREPPRERPLSSGSTLEVMRSPSAGSAAPLFILHPEAPSTGIWCRASINPQAPAAAQIRVVGCPLTFHEAVTAEIRRARRDTDPGVERVQVLPPPPAD